MKNAYSLNMFARVFIKFFVAIVLLTLIGCATKPTDSPPVPSTGRMSDPVITATAVTPVEPVRTARISQDPIPVYHPARIREVRMDAYINERGEAFPPSVKYVVDDPGGWNMGALRNPQQAYVPPSSALEVPTAPGTKYTSMVQSSDSGIPKAGSKLLYNLKDVKITGFTEMSQEARVRGMADPSEAAIFDSKLGWILVPKAVIRGSSPGAKPRPVIATPKLPAQAPLNSKSSPSDFDVIDSMPKTLPAAANVPSNSTIPDLTNPSTRNKALPQTLGETKKVPDVIDKPAALDGSMD